MKTLESNIEELHNEVISCLEQYLKKTDQLLGIQRQYLREFEYMLNNHERHEADLICLMDDRAYLFEVKTGNRHPCKVRKQLKASESWVYENTDIKNIIKFYVSGLPGNYKIMRLKE